MLARAHRRSAPNNKNFEAPTQGLRRHPRREGDLASPQKQADRFEQASGVDENDGSTTSEAPALRSRRYMAGSAAGCYGWQLHSASQLPRLRHPEPAEPQLPPEVCWPEPRQMLGPRPAQLMPSRLDRGCAKKLLAPILCPKSGRNSRSKPVKPNCWVSRLWASKLARIPGAELGPKNTPRIPKGRSSAVCKNEIAAPCPSSDLRRSPTSRWRRGHQSEPDLSQRANRRRKRAMHRVPT